jgi:putative ABC transport system permease protein
MALERVQYLADMPNAVTEILVFGEHRSQDAAIVTQLQTLPSLENQLIQPWSKREPWAGMVGMMSVINGIIMVIIIFITSLGVWNTMTISVMERTGEIGVLRAMGMKRLTAVSLFVIEALMIGILGGTLGVLLGGIPAYYLEVVGVGIGEDIIANMDDAMPFSQVLRADLNGFVIGVTFLTAISMAFVGSALPAIRAAFIQPVEAMRARR